MIYKVHLSNIINSISANSIVYMAIGSSMKYYVSDPSLLSNQKGYTRLLTRQNNQQYPIFLGKMRQSKGCTIILFDHYLEDDLKIPLPLYQTQIVIDQSTNQSIFRKLEYEQTTVFAFHENYDYNDIHFMTRLVEKCLSINSKLIVQDFTGRDLAPLYDTLLDIFGKEEMLPNILFDVTAGNGDCLIEFVDEDCSLYPDGSFVNEKYKRLSQVSNLSISRRVFVDRLKVITNEISWIYITKCKNPECDFSFPEKVYYLFTVYDIKKPENENVTERFGQLLEHLIRDVTSFQQCEPDVAHNIISVLHDRSTFLKYIEMISFD